MKMPEVIGWEYRFKESHPQTVNYGQWYPWERLIPRNPLETVEGRVAEIQRYIDRGYSYELRALYDKQALIDLLEEAANLSERLWPDEKRSGHEWTDGFADGTCGAADAIRKLKETL
jgi:hypothetical protein